MLKVACTLVALNNSTILYLLAAKLSTRRRPLLLQKLPIIKPIDYDYVLLVVVSIRPPRGLTATRRKVHALRLQLQLIV